MQNRYLATRLLVSVFCLALAACSEQSGDDAATPPAASDTASTRPKFPLPVSTT